MPVGPGFTALAGRLDLEPFKPHHELLMALEMRFQITDIAAAASDCLTDDARDKKCDALYIDRDTGTAVIAQAYWAEGNAVNPPTNKAADLNTAAAWVLSGPNAAMGEALLSATAQLHDSIQQGEIQSFEVWFVHNLYESQDVDDELARARDTALSHLRLRYPEHEIPARHKQIGLSQFELLYESVAKPILVADELVVEIDGWFEEVGDGWASVSTSLRTSWLVELYETYGERLFSANVRSYMPSRQTSRNINYNIEQTARHAPGRFWAFNNGITALVNDYERPANHDSQTALTLRGIAIVNGAQTTGALVTAHELGAELRDAFVMARFVRCDTEEIVDDIIRFNNSQNPIKPSDFRSTDRHQDRLREEFQAIPDVEYFGARRGGPRDRARRPSNLISSDTAAQALAAFHGDPGTGYHDLRGIWERDEVYARYFSDFTTATHIVYVYALMAALQRAKTGLVQRAAQADDEHPLTEDEREVLAYFRRRGSIFMLVAAIGACSEIHLGQAVPDRFRLSFGSPVSPSVGEDNWGPIVEASLPFVSQLDEATGSGNLRRTSVVEKALNDFRSVVRATARANESIFADFRAKVVIST